MPRVYPPIEGKTLANQQLSPSIIDLSAGFTAGILTTFAVHPFDVVKTRMQVDRVTRSRVGISLRTARDIALDEGVRAGFYRGLTPNLVGNSVSWGLYFMWYGNIKDAIRTYKGAGVQLTSADYFLASAASGVLNAVITNPIWVIKTRMLSTGRAAPGAYRGMAHGTKELYRTEGIKGFYRGLVPSLVGVSHGALQFMVYEKLKIWRYNVLASEEVSPSDRAKKVQLSNWDFMAVSSVSKIFAGSITYPYQVLRARLQTYDSKGKYTTVRQLLKETWVGEGLAGFYKGIGPNLLRIVPSTWVTFLVYENMKAYLEKHYEQDPSAA